VIGAHLPVLPVVVPLAGALLQPILALAGRRLAWPLAVLASAAATAAAVAGLGAVLARGAWRYAVGGWPPPWGIEVVLDPLSGFMAVTVAGVATLALLAGRAGARAAFPATEPTYYALALLLVTGLLGMIVSGDVFNVFVFLEVASIASYALVAGAGGAALAAAFRYVVLGTVGASFYLLGVGFLYAATGTLNMADLGERLRPLGPSPLVGGGLAFVGIGLAVKMGLFPFHGWLPDAYMRAPAPAAALLAGVATKAPVYVMARFLLHVVRPEAVAFGALLAWAGGAAILAGGVLALRQADARRLLAYSSVSQVGYMALGIGLANRPALAGAYLHVLNHALMKAALFVALAAAALQGRSMRLPTPGLGRRMPVTAACAVVAALSMVGIPPAGGFFSKWYLLEGALAAREPLLAATVLAGGLLAAGYMYRLTEAVWFGEAGGAGDSPEAPATLLVALVVLALLILATGIWNAALVDGVLVPAAGGALP
jgi:multicomponent Na+:H+ antiporter subunit D